MSFTTIRKRRDFLAATGAGKKFITKSIILQMVARTEGHPDGLSISRIGFTVTKKMGNAVIRNRIKRRLREAARPALAKHGVAGHDYVVISRNLALTCEFSELVRDMEFAFSRIIHHKNAEKPEIKKPNTDKK